MASNAEGAALPPPVMPFAQAPLRGVVEWRFFTEVEFGPLGTAPGRFAETTATQTPCVVLVVDDDLAIRETVRALLEDEGYAVAQAANGLEALVCLERQVPKVVLLDMRMPLMDGWEFVEELRKRQFDGAVVAMTATHDARVWAREIGAIGYLGKPFEPDELLALVDRLC
jgi:CheY-like chemotaxis protein